MTDTPKSRTGLLRKFLVLGLSFAFALVVGEVTVRLTVGSPMAERLPLSEIEAHETRGWRMVPGFDHFTYLHPVRVNSLGLRGPELGPKGTDTKRILALGDSLIYGQGVAEEDTLPAALEVELNKDRGGFEVVNAGHRAYGTNQELALLEELAPEIQPDIVLLFWYWNDLVERDIERSFAQYSRRGRVAFDTNKPMVGSDLSSWHRKQWLRRSALLMYLWDAFGAKKPGDTPESGAMEQGFARLGEHLARAQALGAEHGFEFCFVTIPDRRSLARANATRALTTRAIELAREIGIEAIELGPGLEADMRRTGHLPVLPFDGHYDGPANHAMAATLAGALRAH